MRTDREAPVRTDSEAPVRTDSEAPCALTAKPRTHRQLGRVRSILGSKRKASLTHGPGVRSCVMPRRAVVLVAPVLFCLAVLLYRAPGPVEGRVAPARLSDREFWQIATTYSEPD